MNFCFQIMHSMRLNEKLLKPWVIADADGTIISAHCDCVAGVGETCTHVGALILKIHHFLSHVYQNSFPHPLEMKVIAP